MWQIETSQGDSSYLRTCFFIYISRVFWYFVSKKLFFFKFFQSCKRGILPLVNSWVIVATSCSSNVFKVLTFSWANSSSSVHTIRSFSSSNLVPAHLTAWGKRGETLVGSGHVLLRQMRTQGRGPLYSDSLSRWALSRCGRTRNSSLRAEISN